jgi:hypothetical protein
VNASVQTQTAFGSENTRGSRLVLPGQAPDGMYILSILLKRTYDIVADTECMPAESGRPLLPADVHWDEPMNSSVRYESDFIPYKPAVDVVLNATVHAPNGEPTRMCSVSFQVGERRKVLNVIGDRTAKYNGGSAPVFSDPAAFTTMGLRYERAYGGTDVYSDPKVPYPYPRNPLGKGFVIRNIKESVDDLPLPNLEEPGTMLTPELLCLGEFRAWESRPFPAGYGWVLKTWMQRGQLAGVMPADRAVEQELRQAYAELLPADQREPYIKHGIRDMDFRFFNGASPGFVFERLRSGERISTQNLSPDGELSFQLPSDSPRLGLDIGAGVQEPPAVLHTAMIRLDERQVDLVWRGAVPYDGPDWLPKMRKMNVFVG